MPLSLEEILALLDIGQKISYLKKGRKTELPDRCKLWDDWNPERHEIMVDKEKYPDRKVLEKEAEKVFDEKTGKTYENRSEIQDRTSEPYLHSFGARYSEHSNSFYGRHRTVYGLYSDRR